MGTQATRFQKVVQTLTFGFSGRRTLVAKILCRVREQLCYFATSWRPKVSDGGGCGVPLYAHGVIYFSHAVTKGKANC